MILYYPTKFHFNSMNRFRVIGNGHLKSITAFLNILYILYIYGWIKYLLLLLLGTFRHPHRPHPPLPPPKKPRHLKNRPDWIGLIEESNLCSNLLSVSTKYTVVTSSPSDDMIFVCKPDLILTNSSCLTTWDCSRTYRAISKRVDLWKCNTVEPRFNDLRHNNIPRPV